MGFSCKPLRGCYFQLRSPFNMLTAGAPWRFKKHYRSETECSLYGDWVQQYLEECHMAFLVVNMLRSSLQHLELFVKNLSLIYRLVYALHSIFCSDSWKSLFHAFECGRATKLFLSFLVVYLAGQHSPLMTSSEAVVGSFKDTYTYDHEHKTKSLI